MVEARVRELTGMLRVLAENDDAVRRVLDAWNDGRMEGVDLLAATGLSAVEYRTARDRILDLVRDRLEDLTKMVSTTLRDAS